jgi:transposase-like protein
MEKILSLLEFQSKFPDEESCFQYLVRMRWPHGFKCPKCGHTEYYFISGRKLFQCQKCRFQASITAGTVFHNLKQPLTKLFWAVYLTATSKKGISAMELQRKLGIKAYNTAWLLLHKLREAMVSSGEFPLKTLVEADETYVGGAKQGKAGRGAKGKNLVAAAVEVDPETEAMGRAYLKKIPTHSMKELSSFINSRVAKGTKIKTDGLPSYNFLEIEYDHVTTKAKDIENKRELLPKVHIVIANFKTWMRGTFNRYPDKHIQRYIDEYIFRFNRRWNLDHIFDKLLNRCILRTTITFAELTK